VRDLQAINRELEQARERNDYQACVGLINAALALLASQPDRGGYLDSLAYAYEKLGRFDEAIDAMREALAAGWEGELDDRPSAQALIADLLLRPGATRRPTRRGRRPSARIPATRGCTPPPATPTPGAGYTERRCRGKPRDSS